MGTARPGWVQGKRERGGRGKGGVKRGGKRKKVRVGEGRCRERGAEERNERGGGWGDAKGKKRVQVKLEERVTEGLKG